MNAHIVFFKCHFQVKAKDGDSGNSRRIIYDLIENPNNYFVINSNTGEIRVDRALDRESLSASSGVLTLKVKASELVNGVPGESDFNVLRGIDQDLQNYYCLFALFFLPGDDSTTSSIADVTITIRDVNDEVPSFNQKEYDVSIPENVPFGTPLANLNMEVKDTDTGPNSIFKVIKTEKGHP